MQDRGARDRAGNERAARIARADALPVDGDASDARTDELSVNETVAHEFADDIQDVLPSLSM